MKLSIAKVDVLIWVLIYAGCWSGCRPRAAGTTCRGVSLGGIMLIAVGTSVYSRPRWPAAAAAVP